MPIIPIYFDLEELVCKHVYNKYGQFAWSFFDPRLIETIDWIREAIDRPIYANNWDMKGKFSQRGLRCNQCSLLKKATLDQVVYMTAHVRGQALDFDIPGMLAEEVRKWLVDHRYKLPHKIRLEKDTSWVHLDVACTNDEKVNLYYAA